MEVVTKVLSTPAHYPSCHKCSHRKHSRYTRRVADFPMSGKKVYLIILTTKWF
ncbi:transposase family protein [Thalassorhabdus alkalitolerans]|uniref:Transposase family protein n=1 Tax=Thalassorhabdus alkalitolerans TaxID=2282697 RepID=A0ABW0YKP5_9BACI